VPQYLFASTSAYGPPVMLPTLDGATDGEPYDVNASGTVLGAIRTQSGWREVLWNDGVITEPQLPSGWVNFQTGDWRINSAGDIGATGWLHIPPENPWDDVEDLARAFLLRGASAEVLEPLPGYDHSAAYAINDHGWWLV
jgi:hypothetical protein